MHQIEWKQTQQPSPGVVAGITVEKWETRIPDGIIEIELNDHHDPKEPENHHKYTGHAMLNAYWYGLGAISVFFDEINSLEDLEQKAITALARSVYEKAVMRQKAFTKAISCMSLLTDHIPQGSIGYVHDKDNRYKNMACWIQGASDDKDEYWAAIPMPGQGEIQKLDHGIFTILGLSEDDPPEGVPGSSDASC